MTDGDGGDCGGGGDAGHCGHNVADTLALHSSAHHAPAIQWQAPGEGASGCLSDGSRRFVVRRESVNGYVLWISREEA
jgi:hypothetical protein